MQKREKTVARVIALEEAFLYPKLLELYPEPYVKMLDIIKDRLVDVGPKQNSPHGRRRH